MLRRKVRTIGSKTMSAALLASLSIAAASAQTTAVPKWNDSPAPIANIDWVDPLNLTYVNLGDDRFLFDTRQGVKLWDFATRLLAEPRLATAAGVPRIERLHFGPQTWARLGEPEGLVGPGGVGQATPGTVFVATHRDNRSGELLWWNPATQSVATGLPLVGEARRHRLLQIDANSVLVCQFQVDASVVQLVRQGPDVALKWAAAGDPKVKSSLMAAGVVGSVRGFGSLVSTDTDITRKPVFYDTSSCGWELTNPPRELAPHLDKRTRTQNPYIKPYFLSDGRILVPEIDYFDSNAKHWSHLQSALLWWPGSSEWMRLASNRGAGNLQHRVGQNEPVFATGFQSDVIEFFDAATSTWRRSIERMPYSRHVNVEPLRSGQALVLVSETGMVGVMNAASAEDIPVGRLLNARYGYYSEVLLPGNRMMLLGAGDSWHPTDSVELVDMARGQTAPVKQFPPGPRVAVVPSGLPLQDGSVLVFAGLPPRCWPGYYYFGDGACADRSGLPSLRYWPKGDRWEVLPQLKIPFSSGPHWQTGNSGVVAQWPRADVAVRPNGDVVWVDGAEFALAKDREDWPRTSQLKTWSPVRPEQPPRDLARLRKGRTSGTLITLNDGRLAAIGGEAQLEMVALEKDCLDCPDEFVSIGPFKPARSTEVLDESNPTSPVWKVGPLANYGGGKAFKLANGRIFKLSLAVGGVDEYGYQAEVADPAFTAWSRLPSMPKIALPKTHGNDRPTVLVNNVGVIGNRVLLLTNRDMTIVWDDDKLTWLVWRDWPARIGPDTALSVAASPQEGHVFVRYGGAFATVPMPRE